MVTGFLSLLNIASKQIEWVLDKALPDIVLSKQSITLDSDNLTDIFLITTNSDGNLSASSSDTSIATVFLSNNTATVEALTNGICTITVNVAESSNYANGTKTLSVDVQLVSTTLNDNSWNTIKTTIQSGEAASLWNVGDTKEVLLNGDTNGYNGNNYTKSYTNYSCYATILGFDHNASLESNGEHSIHFFLAKDSTGKDLCFCFYRMNDIMTTSGGWNSSKMKTRTMVEFKNCLPVDLQAVLKNVTKYTNNNISGSNNVSDVTATMEQLFLLSEFEIFGVRNSANIYEKDKQALYDYYKNGNSTIRYQDNDPRYTGTWLLRSAHCYSTNQYQFCVVAGNGTWGSSAIANAGYCAAPAFVV